MMSPRPKIGMAIIDLFIDAHIMPPIEAAHWLHSFEALA